MNSSIVVTNDTYQFDNYIKKNNISTNNLQSYFESASNSASDSLMLHILKLDKSIILNFADICIAIVANNYALVKFIVEDKEFDYKCFKNYPLHVAVERNRFLMAKYLISRGASIIDQAMRFIAMDINIVILFLEFCFHNNISIENLKLDKRIIKNIPINQHINLLNELLKTNYDFPEIKKEVRKKYSTYLPNIIFKINVTKDIIIQIKN